MTATKELTEIRVTHTTFFILYFFQTHGFPADPSCFYPDEARRFAERGVYYYSSNRTANIQHPDC